MYSTECNHNSYYLTCQQTAVVAICLYHYDEINNHRRQRHIPENKDKLLQKMFVCNSDNSCYDTHAVLHILKYF
jgi:hypothetical protein